MNFDYKLLKKIFIMYLIMDNITTLKDLAVKYGLDKSIHTGCHNYIPGYTKLFKDILNIDSNGYLITEDKSSRTNIKGVFASGDVQDSIYRQAITAAGSGCMAAIDAERFLEENHEL